MSLPPTGKKCLDVNALNEKKEVGEVTEVLWRIWVMHHCIHAVEGVKKTSLLEPLHNINELKKQILK